jgi:hypothetical protein
MSQVTIYLPEKVAREARRRARKLNTSLSAYVAQLLERETVERPWPKAFVDLLQHGHGDVVEPPDPPPEDIEALR